MVSLSLQWETGVRGVCGQIHRLTIDQSACRLWGLVYKGILRSLSSLWIGLDGMD